MVHGALGGKPDADVALRRLTTKYADAGPYLIAVAHAYRGEPDESFQWLECAYRQRDPSVEFLKVDPLLANLRGDARYKALLRKLSLPE